MPTTGGSDFYPFGVITSIICCISGPYLTGELVI
jgi:hypothetical protein